MSRITDTVTRLTLSVISGLLIQKYTPNLISRNEYKFRDHKGKITMTKEEKRIKDLREEIDRNLEDAASLFQQLAMPGELPMPGGILYLSAAMDAWERVAEPFSVEDLQHMVNILTTGGKARGFTSIGDGYWQA